MKQHDDDSWARRPDEIPIEDAPCMGARKRNKALGGMSKKHLWDKAKVSMKDVVKYGSYLSRGGIPTVHRTGPGWSDTVCWFAEIRCDGVIEAVEDLDEVIEELLGRP